MAGLVRVVRRPPREIDGDVIDFGHVGDVEAVDPTLALVLTAAGYVPVVASVCADSAGALYNVNADTVAADVSAALGAARLDLVTEAGGVRRDPERSRAAGSASSRRPRPRPASPRGGSRAGCGPSWRRHSSRSDAASPPSVSAARPTSRAPAPGPPSSRDAFRHLISSDA